MVAAASGLVYAAVMHRVLVERYHGNYSGFLQLSRERFDNSPLMWDRPGAVRRSLLLIDGPGYDGQFMYYETFDPFLRTFGYRPFTYRSIVDAPTYRYGRIGFSLFTKVVSLDRWRRYPASMVWLTIAGVCVTALFLSAIAARHGAHPLWGLVVIVVPGFWHSLFASLPEPLAAALLVAGYWWVLEDRPVIAGLLFALSLLVRETGVILVVCLAIAHVRTGRGRAVLTYAGIALGVLVAWRLYVAWVLYPAFGREAFFMNPNDVGVPFVGLFGLWKSIASGAYAGGAGDMARAGLAYSVALVAALVLAGAIAVRSPGPVPVAALLYSLMAVSLTYGIWENLENGVRGTYETFVVLALAAIESRPLSRSTRWGLAAFWATAVVFVCAWSPAAATVRDVLVKGFVR